MSLVGYARVSSTDQDLTIQMEALAAAGVEKTFAEKLSGTSTAARDELRKALDWVREGDVLVVTRLDRLARSLVDLRGILDQLTAKGVGFRCLQQQMDTTTSEGRLMLNILGAFAEFETDIRRERQMEGIAKAQAKGVYNKRKPKYSPEEIYRLRDEEGLGASAIAERLGINRTTVYRTAPDGWGETPQSADP